VNVHIANNSNRTVRKIKVSVRQFADICLFSTAQYKCTVAETDSEYVPFDLLVKAGFDEKPSRLTNEFFCFNVILLSETDVPSVPASL
jgi:hypothetical protein